MTRTRSTRTRPSSAREVALFVLRAVDERDAYANLELPGLLRKAQLSTSDSAFATELAYGTLRMRGLYDAVIALCADRTTSDIDPVALDILRLGAHQWVTLGTPAHATVDESVRLARQYARKSAAGFINAVMRRMSSKSAAEWMASAVPAGATDSALSVQFSHPEWVVRALHSALTRDGRSEELQELLRANNNPGPLSLTNLTEVPPQSRLRSGALTSRSFLLDSGDPSRLPEVKAGEMRVQDEGSALAALVLSRAEPIRAGEKWLDMCAGPGGKTAVLAADSAGQSVELVANEISEHRAELVRKSVHQFPHVQVVRGDGERFGSESAHTFDRILLDAPCTGLGALRRRPEARWRRTPTDVSQLTVLQGRLLDSALGALKPGGVLAYVTCSPHLAETRTVVEQAKLRHPELRERDARIVAQRIAPAKLSLSGSDLSVQLWPHVHGTDAMFIALLTLDE